MVIFRGRSPSGIDTRLQTERSWVQTRWAGLVVAHQEMVVAHREMVVAHREMVVGGATFFILGHKKVVRKCKNMFILIF